MKRFLNSERLYLREFTKDDLNLIHELNKDPEVMKYVKDPETLEQSKESLKRYLASYDGNGLGIWALHQMESNEFIGFFIFIKYENTEEIEVGYRLHKKFWGKGFATEITKVLIDYGFDVLELKEMFAVTMPGNKASEKVLKKCGFRNYGTTEKYYERELNYFKIV